VVKAGDVVKVKVLEVDIARKRIALTMRLSDEAAPRKPHDARERDQQKVGSGATANRKPQHHASPAPRREPEAAGAMAAAFAKLKR